MSDSAYQFHPVTTYLNRIHTISNAGVTHFDRTPSNLCPIKEFFFFSAEVIIILASHFCLSILILMLIPQGRSQVQLCVLFCVLNMFGTYW